MHDRSRVDDLVDWLVLVEPCDFSLSIRLCGVIPHAWMPRRVEKVIKFEIQGGSRAGKLLAVRYLIPSFNKNACADHGLICPSPM